MKSSLPNRPAAFAFDVSGFGHVGCGANSFACKYLAVEVTAVGQNIDLIDGHRAFCPVEAVVLQGKIAIRVGAKPLGYCWPTLASWHLTQAVEIQAPAAAHGIQTGATKDHLLVAWKASLDTDE